MKDTYLSDEELLQLMEQVETEELVKAPEYLTENIMTRIQGTETVENVISYSESVKEPQIQTKKKPPQNKKKELVAYGFKVMLSAAASIAILLAIPAAGGTTQPGTGIEMGQETTREDAQKEKPISNALSSINRATSNFCNLLNQSSTELIRNRGQKTREQDDNK